MKTTQPTRATLPLLALLCALSTYGQTMDPFVTTWVTTTADESITIPTTGGGYDYTVTWEEGGTPETGKMGDATHEYATPGTHTVSITGEFPRIYFNNSFGSNPGAAKILAIKKWGDIAWTSMASAFRGCSKLESAGTDLPDLSGVTDMSGMFAFASTFNQDIGNWNVSSVTNMQSMFTVAIAFNQDLSNWNVSSVTNMQSMFAAARAFNQDISRWDVSSVNNMRNMFGDAVVFNQNLSNWNVSSVISMRNMFLRARAFDQDIGNWDVSAVTDFINFLANAELSSENYDALLVGWNKLDLQSGRTFHAGSSQYTSAGAAARTTIDTGDGWTIADGGEVDMTVTFAENDVGTVTDIDGATTATMYVLAAPTAGNKRDNDNALFRIDNMGALSFMSTPDFEDPQDAGMNNIYAVEVTVTTGTDVAKVTVSVSVTNVAGENPLAVVTMISNLSLAESFGTRVIDLSGTFTFDGMLTLMVSVSASSSSSPSAVTATIAGTMLTLTEQGLGESEITVTAMDGSSSTVTDEFTVTVSRPFVTTWKTDMAMESITIPTTGSGYDYTVDWGDGMEDTGVMGSATHTYATHGTHTVSITGTFPRIYFNDFTNTNANADKILTIAAWGDIAWTSMNSAFLGCSKLTYTAIDLPNLSSVTDMFAMFGFASTFNGDLSSWDVSKVNNMQSMFGDAIVFNQDISNWNVSRVENMSFMFDNAIVFNQDISNWDVSRVTTMANMFAGAVAFNRDLSNWDVSKVTNMHSMFSGARAFNQDLSTWNVSMVTNMQSMFSGARAFNQDLSTWNVSAVTDFRSFLLGVELSSENYDALLIGWDKLNLQNGVTFHAGSSQYTSAGKAARATIGSSTGDGWTILDGSEVDMTVSFAENGIGMVTDIDGDAMADMYDLAAPTTANRRDDDNALFRIDPTGALSFKGPPDFERPKDAGMNNIYAAEVTVGTTKVTVSVSVTNVMESLAVATMISKLSLAEGFDTRVIDLSGAVTDLDDRDMLTLSVSTSSPSVVTATIAPGGTTLTLTEQGLGESVITVTAMDGISTVTDMFTVTVSRPFVTTWKTDGAMESITIPTHTDGTYNYTVNWGDDMEETEVTGNASHTYADAGTYRVSITGDFPRVYFNDVGNTDENADRIRTIEKWGDIQWTSMNNAFTGCSKLRLTAPATEVPDLSGVTDMSSMFHFAADFTGNLSNWNVSSVTNMGSMFAGATAFDGNLINWDVSGVTDFTDFLKGAELSSENYFGLLIGWERLDLQNGLAFDAGNSLYTSIGATARNNIIRDDAWTFADGGEVDMTVTFDENSMDMVTDIDGDVTASEYVLSAPTADNRRDDDNESFSIGPTGVLSFMSPPDFEDPQDAGMNNIYAVEVTVTAAGGTVTKVTVSVFVTDVSGADPVVATMISDLSFAEGFGTRVIDLSGTFDGDGDMLTLLVRSASVDVVTAAIADGTTMLTLTEEGSGESVITVTAGSSTVDDAFTVTVSRPFVTTWKTDMAMESITIRPIRAAHTTTR